MKALFWIGCTVVYSVIIMAMQASDAISNIISDTIYGIGLQALLFLLVVVLPACVLSRWWELRKEKHAPSPASNTASKHRQVQLMTVMAMLTALQIVLSRFLSINTQITKIGFAFVPIALCAMLFGPQTTLIVAVEADVLGAFLFPSGPFFPGFTLSAALNALVYSLLLYKKQTVLRVVIAVAVNQFVLSLFLTPFWLSVMYHMPYWATVVSRLPQIAILTVVEIAVNILLIRLIPQLKRAMPTLSARPVMAVKPTLAVEPQLPLPETEKEDE